MVLRRPRGRSLLELRLVALIRHAGIADPVEEHPFAKHLGRRWRFDFAWPDRMVAVEVDGGIWMRGGGRHSRGAGYEADAEKLNTAALLGWCVLRFTRRNLHDGSAILAIRAALATAGSGAQQTGPVMMIVTGSSSEPPRGVPRPRRPSGPSTTAPIRWKRPRPVSGAEGMTTEAFPLDEFVRESVARIGGRIH